MIDFIKFGVNFNNKNMYNLLSVFLLLLIYYSIYIFMYIYVNDVLVFNLFISCK